MKKQINHTMKKFFTQCGMLAIGLMLAASASAIETITYFHNDIVGSPLVATDQSGNVVWKESYRPYGEQLQKQAASANNHLWFADKSYEQSTGLSYSGARYYDPMLGRFMGMDPKGFDETNIQSFNRYAYANNNPYKYIDPDGRESEFVNGYIAGFHNSLSGPNSHATEIRTGSFTFKLGAFVGMELTPLGILASGEAVGGVVATRSSAANAEAARDTLSGSLSPLKGKAPATVTGGYNVRTGEVAARACGGGKCAEDHVVDALGGNKSDVRFTTAVRPRTGEQVPVCPRCEGKYGRDSFPSGTKFKTDQ
jgi:RHS repeat-associated protein